MCSPESEQGQGNSRQRKQPGQRPDCKVMMLLESSSDVQNMGWKQIFQQTVLLLSGSVMSSSLRLHGLQPARLLCPWNFSTKNTGVGCHALLQGIFLTQGLNSSVRHLLHCRQVLYWLSHCGSQEGCLALNPAPTLIGCVIWGKLLKPHIFFSFYNHITFRCVAQWFNICIHKKVITTINLAPIHYHKIDLLCPSHGSEVKASACNAGDLGSIPGSGRSPGEGNGNPLQHSCLENPMGYSPRGRKESDTTERLNFHFHFRPHCSHLPLW